MCGICGIHEYARRVPTTEGILGSMLHSIHHRGPDEEGRYSDGELTMGMRRLSIIDLSQGQQPIKNEDGRFVVIFNGEIYNYKELRTHLQQRGHTLRTHSDTEVIVHLFEDYGVDCVHHLRGMFAFALWDTQERSLFIARDHLGVKPLYYTQMGDRLIFGSEIKAILQHPDVSVELDLNALSDYLSFRYVPAPHTLFKNIHLLPSGYWLKSDPQGVKTQQYWDVEFTDTPYDPSRTPQYAAELEALIADCVERQLVSDVPFGAFLSGGIDSSSIVALMSQVLKQPVKTFSVGFAGVGEEHSELPYARLVAQKYQTDHHEVLVSAEDFVNDLPKVIWHLDQPIADYAQVAYYKVSQLAAQHVKMVLTGEGGDELFAGYGRYAGERYAPVFRHIPDFIKSMALQSTTWVKGFRRSRAALYALSQSDEASRLANWIPMFNSHSKAELLNDAVASTVASHHSRDAVAQYLARTSARNGTNRMLYVDTKLWLPDYLLLRGDKLTMAASLEGRVPLLDHKLVEFAAQLPPQLKLKGLVRKYLLKQVSSKWLPPENINRKKKGFPVPVPEWLRGSARPFMRDLLTPSKIRQRGLFNPDFVERLLVEHEQGEADHATTIYGLLSLELWQQQFIDKTSQRVLDVQHG